VDERYGRGQNNTATFDLTGKFAGAYKNFAIKVQERNAALGCDQEESNR